MYNRSPPLVYTFYVSLTIISRCVPGEPNSENRLFDQYTWVERTLGTGKPQPCNLTSAAFYARAHQRDSTGKFNRGRLGVTPHGITQPHLVRWPGLHTIHYSCTLCYWNIIFTFVKWSLSVPFELLMPCWNDGDYSYLCLHSIVRDFCHRGHIVATPQCRKLTCAVWVSDDQKDVSCKNINWLYFPRLVEAWAVLWCDIVSVDDISHGVYD